MDEQLPTLADVILKVRQLENLTPLEEFVYLVYIEEVPEELAREMIAGRVKEVPPGNENDVTQIENR